MWRNGEEIELEAPATIIDDLTFIPLRAVSEAFGATVNWDGETKTVYVEFSVPETSEGEQQTDIITFSDDSDAPIVSESAFNDDSEINRDDSVDTQSEELSEEIIITDGE
jgi:hypothetical protein